MPTRTHRAIRRVAPFLDRMEPYAIFTAYIAVGIMAAFVWVFPPKVASSTAEHSLIIEGALLSLGAVLGLWGHIHKKVLIEFWGLCAATGGVGVLLAMVIESVLYQRMYNYGQFIGLVLLAMTLMFAHGFKLYHEITRDWINLTPSEIDKIYSGQH